MFISLVSLKLLLEECDHSAFISLAELYGLSRKRSLTDDAPSKLRKRGRHCWDLKESDESSMYWNE
jgi:hypothetical protein